MKGKRRTKLNRIQNPGGHKEGRASFPIQSQYKVSKIHTPKPTPRKEKGGGRKERGEMPGERGGVLWSAGCLAQGLERG